MQTFFCKLLPPRPTFPMDMSQEEGQLMAAHAAYWQSWMREGNVIAYGPVSADGGAYGIGIVQFEDDAGVRLFVDNDPTIRAGVGFRMEISPMPRGVITPAG